MIQVIQLKGKDKHLYQLLAPLVKSLHYFPHETFYYTYFHYTYKKQSLFASGNGNKDYFFQLGIAVTDR